MASSSQPLLSSSQQNFGRNSSITQDSKLGSLCFPSLEEVYGVNGGPSVNPRNGGSTQKGHDVAASERNFANTEIITPCEVEKSIDLEKNCTSSLNGAIGGSNTSPNLKDWRAIFPVPRPVAQQAKMKFTPPIEVNGKVVVAAQSENFSDGMKKCENMVVGFFVGKRHSFSKVQLAASKLWKFKKEVTIKLHDNCAFIFEFLDEDDRRQVLDTGSVYISGRLFTLRPWTHLLEKSISNIQSVPIWVLIYGVPLHMWNSEGLGLISSYLGKPLLADECTIRQKRLAYARICIEIDLEFSYPTSIPLLIDAKFAMDLPVEYQWKPAKCEVCKVFGHTAKSCSRKMKTRWTPKKIISQENERPTQKHIGVNGNHSVSEILLDSEKRTCVNGVSEMNRDSAMEKQVGFALSASATEMFSDESGIPSCVDGPNTITTATNIGSKYPSRDESRSNFNIGVSVTPPPCNDGTYEGQDNAQGEWIVAGRKHRKGNNNGDHIEEGGNRVGDVADIDACSIGAKKTSDYLTSKVPSPAKSSTNSITKGSGAGGIIIAAINGAMKETTTCNIGAKKTGNQFTSKGSSPSKNCTKSVTNGSGASVKTSVADSVKVQKVLSPKKNSFVVFSDDLVERELEFEKNLQYLSLEEKIAKRKERELHRLQWNGKESGSSKDGGSSIENQNLGRGQRSQTKKRHF